MTRVATCSLNPRLTDRIAAAPVSGTAAGQAKAAARSTTGDAAQGGARLAHLAVPLRSRRSTSHPVSPSLDASAGVLG